MCKCTPNIKTPFCGRGDCQWPKQKEGVSANTDRELWREPTRTGEDGSNAGMEPSVFVTEGGGIGFNYYGYCVVKPIEDWVSLAWNDPKPIEKPVNLVPELALKKVLQRIIMALHLNIMSDEEAKELMRDTEKITLDK